MIETSTAHPATDVELAVNVRDLSVAFSRNGQSSAVVSGLSFRLRRGEVLTILGESGSGKSVTLRGLMGVLPAHATVRGDVEIGGRSLYAMAPRQRAQLRGPEIAMIYQEPAIAFDPVFPIGHQIVETIMTHEPMERRQARARALELLEMVAIPSARRRLKNFPHELSGGMRQRAMIALALACKPKVLLADEPTTALDVTVQMQILLLLRELQKSLGMAVIFVTHDIGVAAEISDRIAVMYAGRFVETGSASEVLLEPRHPYTEGLLASTVRGRSRHDTLNAIPGQPPDLARLPPGCAFAPRCHHALAECGTATPRESLLSPERMIRCIRVGAVAPAVA